MIWSILLAELYIYILHYTAVSVLLRNREKLLLQLTQILSSSWVRRMCLRQEESRSCWLTENWWITPLHITVISNSRSFMWKYHACNEVRELPMALEGCPTCFHTFDHTIYLSIFLCLYLSFGAVVCVYYRSGAQLGGVAWCWSSWILTGCLYVAGGLGSGQILTHLLSLSLLDVVPSRVLEVSLHL